MPRHVGPYRLGRTLGQGAFGRCEHSGIVHYVTVECRVKEGIHTETKTTVAIKILSKSAIKQKKMAPQIMKEVTSDVRRLFAQEAGTGFGAEEA